MALDKTMVKDNIRRIEKTLTKSRKQFSETGALISGFQEIYNYFEDLKTKTALSTDDKKIVGLIIKATSLLDGYFKFCSDLADLQAKITNINIKVKEVSLFLETFRTTRKYKVKDSQKIFRFLSGFLSGFSESYIFKPEFIGDMDTGEFISKLGVTKEGPYLKVPYTLLPKVIEYAYLKKMKNFVIESHNLKMIFQKDYVITIYTENDIIKKIDRLAKEMEIDCDQN